MPALRRVAASHRNHSADAATSAADRAAEKIPATLRSGPVSTQAADTPPSSVVSAVSRIVAQDLSDVAVWRDEESGNAAAQLDARAFTADGEIHMPPGHGSANDRRATALLAHELTHVAQQRRTAFGVPSEGSPQGRRLEAEALAVERSVMRHGVTMTRPRPAATTPVTGARDHRAAATASRVRPGVQRAEDNVTAVGGVNDEAGDRGFEHVDLDELARRLYGRLRRELRDELLLDRERAGLAVERW